MDTQETAGRSLAAVEAQLHPSKEPDETRTDGREGVEERHERTRPVVERRSIADARSFPQTIF